MKQSKQRFLLKRAYYIASIFLIGAMQLFIVRQNAKASIGLELSLVRNKFLDKPPTNIVVMGEINSGHKYAANILRSAFGDMTQLHEHIFRHDLLDQDELQDVKMRTDILWVMVVRSPCDAADAVIRFHKDACKKQKLPAKRCDLHEFASEADYYRTPWYDVHSNETDADDTQFIDSKPSQTWKYDDIFDMRRQKLLLMKQIIDVVPRHVKILRLSEFELNPDVFVKDLVKEYTFDLTKTYKPAPPVINPQSLFFNPNSIFSCMEYSKWKEAQTRIDWTLEGYFGYDRLDCHLCRDSSDSVVNGLSISAPSKIYILGERNSGTTYVSKTLAEAFDPPNSIGSDLEKFSSDIPVLLHKHMFRHDLLKAHELEEIRSRDDILWVMVIRSPCDWAEGMFRKPYHLCPPKHPEKCGPESNPNAKIWMNQNSVAGMSLLEFFTEMEWKDWAESVPFMRKRGEGKGEGSSEEVAINKVSANYTYPNIFKLRHHKLEIMKQIIETVPRNVKFVHLKELERSPELFIQGLVKEFNMTVKEGYQPQPPSQVAHPTVCLTPEEWDAAQKGIDWKIEADFAFSPTDCRMCYGYEKSKKLYTRVMEGKKINAIVNKKNKKSKSLKKKVSKGQEVKSDGKEGKKNESPKKEQGGKQESAKKVAKAQDAKLSKESDRKDDKNGEKNIPKPGNQEQKKPEVKKTGQDKEKAAKPIKEEGKKADKPAKSIKEEGKKADKPAER